MKRTKDYDPTRRGQYYERIWVNGKASAEKCANLRDKILGECQDEAGA